MAARLKVFTWADGFHRYTVATSSRAKALEAWGFSRDLFKTGDAQEITEGDDYRQALEHPGASVERGLAIDMDKVVLKAPAKPKPPAPAKPAGPNRADRERVDKLQAELDAAAKTHDAARADIDRRRADLDAEARALDDDFRARRMALTKALDAARRRLTA